MVIKSGKPTVIAAGSPALGQSVAETTPNDISVTNVIANILDQFNDAAMVVIDPQEGKVYASSIALTRTALGTALENPSVLYLEPDASQTGRSLSFKAATGNTYASIVTTDLTTAVKPKFTVESLVARLLTKIQEREAAVPADAGKFFVVVDQVNKKVGIARTDSDFDTRENLEGQALATGESVKIELTPAAEDSVSDPLPFEGGAV